MRIESLKIENYRVFRRAELRDIPGLCVLIGPNGSGKSTLFDVFGFLRDSLIGNVSTALAKRGGFDEVISRGSDGNILFELKFRDGPEAPLVTYRLEIGQNSAGRIVVEHELLRYRRGQHGRPWHFLDFRRGRGMAITNEEDYGQDSASEQREEQTLESPDILAIKGLGQFARFKVVSSFRRLIENWHVSDFHIQSARPSHDAGYAEHLSPQGENLSLVTQYLYQHHRPVFDQVLESMSRRVPGISEVSAEQTVDGRVVLRFQDDAFRDPFVARYVSDGTIKMFAYLVLLYDPSPHPLLCVEEPENQLYPALLAELAEEFRLYAGRGGQAFVSSHSPDFLNGVELTEIYWLAKEAGYSTFHRAAESATLRTLVDAGDTVGALWTQGLFRSDIE